MEPPVDTGDPDLEAWQAWHPREAAAIFANLPAPWYVAGGWAIDLSLGRQTREHEDLEIAISRADFGVYRGYIASLGRFDLYDAGIGGVSLLTDGREPDPDNHQVWLCERAPRVWRTDTFLEPSEGDTWISHRDPRIRTPMADAVRHDADAIPYQAPALALFLKAKHTRPKDDADLAVTLPTLEPEERRWLAHAIELVHPGHRWLTQL